MIICAIILIIISLSKIIISLSDSYFDNTLINYDSEWLRNMCCAILTGDGLIGLICGLFILFI